MKDRTGSNKRRGVGQRGRMVTMKAPAGAIAYKYADPTEDARWIFDEDDLATIKCEDPSLVVEMASWRTEAEERS